ncbi:hypothetical protein DFH06DRAFT_1197363 [Mycena polygramma]|nr:hypothetical protein DFH06DRAFT_1197363 [Mycena polygramma]
MASQLDKHLESDSSAEHRQQLLLTEAPSERDAPQLEIGGSPVKLDDLGPLMVNSDGIANWPTLTAAEKANTIRVLSARNKIRLANEEQKSKDSAAITEHS